MWPPNNVVRDHKRRAHFIWISFLALIIGYSIWLLVFTYEKRKNPTVSLRLEEDRYAFPTISICVYASNNVGYGCDSVYLSCAPTLRFQIVGSNGFHDSDPGWKTPKPNEKFNGSCVDLNLSSLTEEDPSSGLFPPSINIQAMWNIYDGNATMVSQNSEGALVFFTDPDIADPLGDHNMSSFIGAIPFTRQAAGEPQDTFEEVDIAMALTESLKLDGTNTKTYTADTISSKSYGFSEEWGAPLYDTGHLFMNVLQPSLTDTIREEIDPLEWTELLGNIGGTWELVLILWGIFFVAIHNGPQYKGRDLIQAVREGAQNAVKGATSIASTVGTRQDSGTSSLSESKEEVEVVPAWDSFSGITSEGWPISTHHVQQPYVRRVSLSPSSQRLRSINQDHPLPPPGYGFSEGHTQATPTAPNRTGGGCHAQVASGVRKSLGGGLNQAPSKNTPVVDDLPRPGWRPL